MTNISAEFEFEIRRMIDVTDTEKIMRSQITEILNHIGEANPEFSSDITRVANRIDTSALIDRLVPVYASCFSHEMVTAVADFYSTDVGRKFVKAQPLLTEKITPISQEWIMNEVKKVVADKDSPTIH